MWVLVAVSVIATALVPSTNAEGKGHAGRTTINKPPFRRYSILNHFILIGNSVYPRNSKP